MFSTKLNNRKRDVRVTDDVLGMDILSQIYFMYECKGQSLFFSNNPDELKAVLS